MKSVKPRALRSLQWRAGRLSSHRWTVLLVCVQLVDYRFQLVKLFACFAQFAFRRQPLVSLKSFAASEIRLCISVGG